MVINGTVNLPEKEAAEKNGPLCRKNAKNLVIVESPAKAKTIERFLGSSYKVMASRGHLRDLPRNQFGVNIEDGFTPSYTNMWDKRKLIEELQDEFIRSKKSIWRLTRTAKAKRFPGTWLICWKSTRRTPAASCSTKLRKGRAGRHGRPEAHRFEEGRRPAGPPRPGPHRRVQAEPPAVEKKVCKG